MKSASVNTWRVKLGSTRAAREYLEGEGFVSTDRIHYVKYDDPLPEEPIPSVEPSGRSPVLVTSYLIGSSVNPAAFKALKSHSEFLKAEIIVIAHRYTNPTTLQGCLREEEGADYVDPLVAPYLSWTNSTIYGHDILGGVQVNCSNLNPLPRIKKFTIRHSILGHPMQSLHVKPAPSGMPVVLWSTGTISDIDPAANLTAQQAQFHYKFGWIVLDSDGSSRNVHTTKKGDFTDGGEVFTTAGESFGYIEDARSTVATIWGDVHIEQVDPQALKWATRLTKGFRSPTLVLHDYFDATAVNPHSTIYDRKGHQLVPDFYKALGSLDNIERDTQTSVIYMVESNHNDMLSRFFKRTAVENMEPQQVGLFQHWLKLDMSAEKMFSSASVRVINESDGMVLGTYLGLHGDKGINGAKGSLNSFFQANIRAILGHSHTPGMLGGVSQVGCLCKLKMGYNDKGASSWCHSIVRLDIFGKHQHFLRFA